MLYYIVNLYLYLDINFSLLNVTVINTTSNSVTVRCTTTYTAAMGRYCKITINGTTNMSSFNGNTATVSITGLTYNTTYTYTASLVNISGLPLTGTCIIVVDNFTSDLSPPITTSTSISIIPTSTTTSGLLLLHLHYLYILNVNSHFTVPFCFFICCLCTKLELH